LSSLLKSPNVAEPLICRHPCRIIDMFVYNRGAVDPISSVNAAI
jgi:hypothetical protein